MSETPAISRSPSAEEFARRMRMIGQPAPAGNDPFAELARLVGQEDPFKGLFPQEQSKARTMRSEPTFSDPPAPPEAPRSPEPYPLAAEELVEVPETYQQGPADDDFAAFDHEFRGAFEPSGQSGAPVEPAVVHGPAGYYADQDGGASAAYQPVSYEAHQPVESSPDVWAQGGPEASTRDGAEGLAEPQELDPTASGSSRRTLIVLAAVVVLTTGGLAASFLAHPSRAASAVGAAPPTIMASTGPTKVQPPAPVAGDDGASEPSTLLDKNKNDGTATAKVVNSVEQPVDLSQAVKPEPLAEDSRPSSSSPFPEPRKVKIVMVRPDGTIITNPADGAPLAPRLADVTGNINQEANLAFDTHTAMHQPSANASPATTPDPAPAPATPRPGSKARARAGSTPAPQAVDESAATAQGETPAAGADPNARQPGTPAHVRPKPKPVEQASAAATPDSGASTTGGGFAVQLGAPPTAQEAKEVSMRLQKKFAEQLGSYRPAIHEGKAGDKSVFRIRVGNLTQDDARSLCSKLQAGGGACFVVRN